LKEVKTWKGVISIDKGLNERKISLGDDLAKIEKIKGLETKVYRCWDFEGWNWLNQGQIERIESFKVHLRANLKFPSL
jgi:hypothetical protein